MAIKQRYPLTEKIRAAAGILLLFASLTEAAGIVGEYGSGIDPRIRLLLGLISAAAAILILLKVRYAIYAALPIALGIFFYEIYRAASTTVSLFTILVGVSFFAAALLSFMLIRADKT